MSIKVRDLTKIYGEQRAVDNISFTASQGMITGFLGPNGAGKSTTMKIATGYLSADRGDIEIDGHWVSKEALKVKKIIGYLPEHNPLYVGMYVKEFLGFVADVYHVGRREKKEKIGDIIALCGLEREKHKRIGALSKGYRQRVGLAKALIPDPSVLILDEPTTGLDPNQILEIRNVIKDISKEKTVLLSTHIMQEVEALCDKVVIINKGTIVADDSIDNLKAKSNTSTTFRVEFEKTVPSSLFESIPGVQSIVQGQKHLEITSEEQELKRRILNVVAENDLPLISIRNAGGSLEEVFHSLTQDQEVQP